MARVSLLARSPCSRPRIPDSILAEKAHRDGIPCVVVLDNAAFHTSGMIREREQEWESKGVRLHRLPAYCPHLNRIEGVWRRLKEFLMPRRFYNSVAD